MVYIDTHKQTITIDGVTISLDVLRMFANPDPHAKYSFVRDGDKVIATKWLS